MRQVLCQLANLYYIVLLVHVVFSLVPRPPEPLLGVRRVVRALVEPVVAPIRRVVPPVRTGAVAFDVSILLVFFAVLILQQVLCG